MNYFASILATLLLATTLYPPFAYSGAAPETAGQILAKLSKLPPEQRQKQLIEKAKAEGEVAFYSSLQAQQIDPFVRVFRPERPEF